MTYYLLQLHSHHKLDITATENTTSTRDIVSKPSARAVHEFQAIAGFPYGVTRRKPTFAALTCLPWLINGLVCLDEGATAGLADQDVFLLLNTDPFACDDQFDSGNLLCAISWRCNLYRERD